MIYFKQNLKLQVRYCRTLKIQVFLHRSLKIYVLFMFDNPYFGIFLPVGCTVITKL